MNTKERPINSGSKSSAIEFLKKSLTIVEKESCPYDVVRVARTPVRQPDVYVERQHI